MIANRTPIIVNGQVEGALGRVVFSDTRELTSLFKRVSHIEEELSYYKRSFNASNQSCYTVSDIIGQSKVIQNARALISTVGKNSSNVMIFGESGTGKELYAHALHNESLRRDAPFVILNCAAIPSELLESELFGYTEGAFTGAAKGGKMGYFQAANGGTIFLDEIGEMSLPMQAKMLRVLQEKEVQKIGATAPEQVDVRLVVATNKNLRQMVQDGQFRDDLYYRLNVVEIVIPPLRERTEDIPLLARHFIDKVNRTGRMRIDGITPEAMEYLMRYSWPGNIRELENIIEGAGNFIGSDRIIHRDDLPAHVAHREEPSDQSGDLAEQMDAYERKLILDALIQTKGNRVQAARLLGISRTSLYERINKHSIVFKKGKGK